MKTIASKIWIILALLVLIPISMFSLASCKSPDKEPTTPDPVIPDEVVDENPNSPVKSGIYRFAKEKLSLSDILFLDDGSKAAVHFGTDDINGIRGVIDKNKEKYNFDAYAESITSQGNLKKCVEFNTKNEVSTYVVDSGFYKRISKFSYTCDDFLFLTDDKNAPVISYTESLDVLTLIYKFYYEEDGEMIFPDIYIQVDLVYECESLDMMTEKEDMKEFKYKENSAKLVNAQGGSLDAANYNKALINTFKLDADTQDAFADVTTLLSGYKVNVATNLLAVIINDSEENFKFSFNSVSNGVIVIRNIAFSVNSSLADLANVEQITVSVVLENSVMLKFDLVKTNKLFN